MNSTERELIASHTKKIELRDAAIIDEYVDVMNNFLRQYSSLQVHQPSLLNYSETFSIYTI